MYLLFSSLVLREQEGGKFINFEWDGKKRCNKVDFNP